MKALATVALGGSRYTPTRLGMGCWAIGGHGWGPVRDKDSIRAIKYAVEAGCTFFDTADVYGLGHSERILREALAEQRSQVVIATKGGVRWNAAGKTWHDCSPGYLSNALDESRRRLGLDILPLYYVHWMDDVTSAAAVIEAMARFREEGKIGAIGISNFSLEELKKAIQITRIDTVQVKYNILSRDEAALILPVCRENRITPVFHGALAEGLLTGKFTTATTFGTDDHRSRMPDFQGKRFFDNLRVIDAIRSTTAVRTSTLGQIALRWILDETEDSAVLFGAKTKSQVEENLQSAETLLSDADRKFITSLARPPDDPSHT